MSQRALSDPTILVNNVPFKIVPNSVVFKDGYGEINVRSATTGGGTSQTVHTENAENRVSMVKFEAYITDEIRAAIPIWKRNVAGNFVSGIDRNNLPFSCPGASMTNDPEFNPTADGTVEIEFMGDPDPKASV